MRRPNILERDLLFFDRPRQLPRLHRIAIQKAFHRLASG
jgi:hypothetical protein